MFLFTVATPSESVAMLWRVFVVGFLLRDSLDTLVVIVPFSSF